MRFLLYLPLLLLAAAGTAQINCQLTDLTASVGVVDPVNCQYFVTLAFVPVGTTNQFQVHGNGHNYGTFSYTQLPVVLGPFTAGATAATQEFAVQDAVNADCHTSINVTVPACACTIEQLTAEANTCNADSTYHLSLNFSSPNATMTDSFAVYANGQYFGRYTVTQLPLQIPNFPWNGGAFDEVQVCLQAANTVDCCKKREFHVPACLPYEPCELSHLYVETGDCSSDSTFQFSLNFQVATPAQVDSFDLWASGHLLGHFALSQLPLNLPDFPWNGNVFSSIRVCTGPAPACCRELRFLSPACLPFGPCTITDVFTQTSSCTTSGGYALTVNFQGTNPGNGHFTLSTGNQVIGTYPLTALPLTIPNFPAGSSSNGVVKICINDVPGTVPCCAEKHFPAPNCAGDCNINDLTVQTGDCHSDSTYQVVVNFHVTGTTATTFQLFANGQLFNTYNLSQLPLTILNFPWNGGNNDVIKVCMGNSPAPLTCCETREFAVPGCLQNDCEIFDVVVTAGDCNPAGGYSATVNFQVHNTTSNSFDLYANGQLLGTYPLSALPLPILNFPASGNAVDHIKICIHENPACCREKAFSAPNCAGNCSIDSLTVHTGDCHGDSAYQVVVNFHATGTTATAFQVFANGQLFNTYNLNQLPLTIPNFPWNGGNNDVIKVCIGDNSAALTCCETREFAVPGCLQHACEVSNVVVTTGDCHVNENTFVLTVNFQAQNPGNTLFDVTAGNGQVIGTFPLSALPLTIPNFPWEGGAVGHIKICINDQPNCCKVKEFPAPTCFGGNCEIHDLTVQTGNCQEDSTYQATVNFQVTNPPLTTFSVYINGQFYGSFQLGQLPLSIPHFPWNGGNNDVIKICFGTNGSTACCKTLEFAVPGCLLEPCHITDLQALHTACLCGQFFAILTFNYQNGSAGGFDITGNGHNYGTFPYSTNQPIILGPLTGDNTTMYEFNVHDHLNPDCHDVVQMGKVDCPSFLTLTGSPATSGASLLLAPNPTDNWLNATALLPGGLRMGQTQVQIFYADGRLVVSQSVADGNSFQIDVSGLPTGIYRLDARSEAGSLEGTFTKN